MNLVDNILPQSSDELPECNADIMLKSSISKPEQQVEKCCDPNVTTFIEEVIYRNAVKFNFKRTGVSSVLKDLKQNFPLMKSDYRSVMSTPRHTITKVVDPGLYVNFDWQERVRSILTESLAPDNCSIKFDIFIDGICFQTDAIKRNFWVVLGRVLDKIFVIGLYNGRSHPKDFNLLLSDFVETFKEMSERKLYIEGKEYEIEIRNVILDSPAKAAVKYVKYPTGYSSCCECCVEGHREDGRITFTELDCTRRTDESFRARADIGHHNGSSIFESSFRELDMINNFPPDYLHVVLLGGLKKILTYLFIPPKSFLPFSAGRELTSKLLDMDKYVPSEFHRHLRPISELKQYHGHELRFFLLKVGIVALKGVIPNEYYLNFLYFHIGITILCDEDLATNYSEVAKLVLHKFVEKAMDLYGPVMQTLIVHTISHLADAVQYQGIISNNFNFNY